MRKLLWTLTTFFALLWMTIIIILISTQIQILEPEEQQKINEGKFFWEWHSDYGPLAMHYIEKGQGSNHILLMHGFRAYSYTWRALIDPLAEAGYHVWAIDLIGYGLSDKPINAIYNVDFFVQQVKAFMDAKNITKAHLVGNSMGGGLALCIALSHPKYVHSLTLLSALGYPLDMPFYIFLARHISQIWTPFLSSTMIRYGLQQIVYNKDQITDEQVEAYRLPYRLPGGIAASLLTLQQFDNRILAEMRKYYASFSYPTLIIWGDHDILIPIQHYERFIQDFPHASKLLITNCGHIPQEEEPQQVLTAMLDFLQKIN